MLALREASTVRNLQGLQQVLPGGPPEEGGILFGITWLLMALSGGRNGHRGDFCPPVFSTAPPLPLRLLALN